MNISEYEFNNKFYRWALRHGPVVLGAMSSISSLMINKHYRFKFKLGNFGYVASSFPLAVMPGILTLLFHKYVSICFFINQFYLK